ncbi:MAG: CoA-binding protein [Chloroflexota bacterium]|nr:MAG: CoA-binding protein [Chloroflexota bacterium]
MKVDFSKLDRAFNPQTVVVVGDSKATNFGWLRAQLKFKGKLYSVHVNRNTFEDIRALGVTNYTSLLDVPGPIDLVVVAVARKAAVSILDDCIRKDVAAAHFFSAGFSETHTQEGIELERQLIARAEKANFHLIGPNCMGLFNPKAGIRQNDDQYLDVSGSVGLISQSGSIAIAFGMDAYQQGLYINKSVSYGNGIVVDSPDFLEYFGNDPEIKIIGMYVEGVKNGRRFLDTLKEIASKKPVVIWKGGRTEEGGRAIASHTGALALSRNVWDAAIKQCGAIQVTSMDELVDTIKALLFLPPVRGKRVAIAGGPGGQSVIGTDIFAEAGLNVPQLTKESYAELETFFEVVGGSYRNPIDTAGPVRRDMKRIMGVVSRDANIDNIAYIVSTRPGRSISTEQFQNTLAVLEDIKNQSKPLIAMVFLHTPDASREVGVIIKKLQERSITAFPSIPRGARALKNAFDYYNHSHGYS